MESKIINGSAVAARIRGELKERVAELKSRGINPGLAVIIAGDDPASKIYVNLKKKACEEIGILSEEYALDGNIPQAELASLLKDLSTKKAINGILIQQPLPGHLDVDELNNLIDHRKDVDGFHPVNMGKLMMGKPGFIPCTPAGVMELIKEAGTDIAGKECVVVGRSNIVGKPMASLLLTANGTVTVCHSKTRDLAGICRRADILVVAIGKARMITGDMIKPGATVIDVGMNRLEDKKVAGDVDFDSAVRVAGAITPVPGGVGPMTIAMLMGNTVRAAEMQNGI